jgi:hypothetical protein
VTEIYGATISINDDTVTISWTVVTARPTSGDAQYTYTFTGWTNTCWDTLTWDCTITANFAITVNEYIVSFDSNGWNYTPESESVPCWSIATKPTPDPTKPWYTFSGWILNWSDFDFSTPITWTTNLVAKWIDDTKPTITLISKTNTINTTGQTATLKCSDWVWVTAYYWWTVEPASAN